MREWRRQLAERHAELLLEAGQADSALPELERLARAEPLRERPHLLLLRGLHLVGRTAEALTAARAYRRRLAEKTGLDPSEAVGELEQRLRADDPALRPVRCDPKRSVRTATDRFVGRAAELAALRAAVRDHRVVSVVGPGGVGKTRLVLELVGSLDRAVQVAELARVGSAADVGAAVGAELGLRSAPAGIAATIAERLGPGPVLLVLDNCEHVLAAARDLATELLGRCPALTVLSTSRRRLGVAGEQVVRLGPLSAADRVELFRDRAALLRPGFDPSRPEVPQICDLVDGLPLAVELAARREAVFGLAELRDRLRAGLQVLEPAGAGDRSDALVPTAEWSYRLLDPAAQALFDRASVAPGGFDLIALEHLAPTGIANPPAVLAELVEASMVLPDLSARPPRYRLLEPLRQIGLVHLGPTGLPEARDRLTRWMAEHLRRVRGAQDERSPAAQRRPRPRR